MRDTKFQDGPGDDPWRVPKGCKKQEVSFPLEKNALQGNHSLSISGLFGDKKMNSTLFLNS